MANVSLGLVVIRTQNIEAAGAFYRAVGLSLVEEKHGSGPVHYSCQLGETVVEIYPAAQDMIADHLDGGSVMLGFQVGSLDVTLKAIEQTGARLISAPKNSLWGRRAVVADPDGRAVEINELPRAKDTE